MRLNAVRFAAGLALIGFGAPLPAYGQYFPPPLIVVPPPAQDYAAPRQAPDRARPARPNPQPQAETPPQTRGGHYEGRTYVPD